MKQPFESSLVPFNEIVCWGTQFFMESTWVQKHPVIWGSMQESVGADSDLKNEAFGL